MVCRKCLQGILEVYRLSDTGSDTGCGGLNSA